MHVDRDNFSAKFWLDPVGLAYNLGFSPHELRRIQKVIHDIPCCGRHGVTHTEPRAGEGVKDVRLSDDALSVDLLDGRTITVPPATLQLQFETNYSCRFCSPATSLPYSPLNARINSPGSYTRPASITRSTFLSSPTRSSGLPSMSTISATLPGTMLP